MKALLGESPLYGTPDVTIQRHRWWGGVTVFIFALWVDQARRENFQYTNIIIDNRQCSSQ